MKQPPTPPEPRKVRGDYSPIKSKRYYPGEYGLSFCVLAILFLVSFIYREEHKSGIILGCAFVFAITAFVFLVLAVSEAMKKTLKL